MVEKIHRVSRDDLAVGEKVERSEHPWASPRTARNIARDHLQRDPNAYSSKVQAQEKEIVVVLNQNVKAVPARKKRKMPVQRQQQSSGPAWIPQAMRMWG